MSKTNKKTYYDVLGVSSNATVEEITSAYKKLIRKTHPDLAPPEKRAQAERAAKELNEAYDVLKNTVKRAQYDRELKYGNETGHMTDMADMFEAFFNGTASRTTNMYDLDIKTEISYTYEELLFAIEKNSFPVTYNVKKTCSTCDGKGVTSPITCHTCKGTGYIYSRSFFFSSTTCSTCNGKGVTGKRCTNCKGMSYTIQQIKRDLPMSAFSIYEEIHVRGGGSTFGRYAGDLTLLIKLQDSPNFFILRQELYYVHKVNFTEVIARTRQKILFKNGISISYDIPKIWVTSNPVLIPRKGFNFSRRQIIPLNILVSTSVPCK